MLWILFGKIGRKQLYKDIEFSLLLTKNVGFCFRAEKIYDKISKNLDSKDLEG